MIRDLQTQKSDAPVQGRHKAVTLPQRDARGRLILSIADLLTWAFENGARRADLIGRVGPAGYGQVDMLAVADMGTRVETSGAGPTRLPPDVETIMDALGRIAPKALPVLVDQALLGTAPEALPEVGEVVDLFAERQTVQVFGRDGALLSHITASEWRAAQVEPVRVTPFDDDDEGLVQDFIQQQTPAQWVHETLCIENMETARGIRNFISLLRKCRGRYGKWYWGLVDLYAQLQPVRERFTQVALAVDLGLLPLPSFQSIMATCTTYLAAATTPKGTDIRGCFEWLEEVKVRPELIARYDPGEARMALAKLRADLRKAEAKNRKPTKAKNKR